MEEHHRDELSCRKTRCYDLLLGLIALSCSGVLPGGPDGLVELILNNDEKLFRRTSWLERSLLGMEVNDLWMGRHTPDNPVLLLASISGFASVGGGSALELEAALVESGWSLGEDISLAEVFLLFLVGGKVGVLRMRDLFDG
jgi:hypothetical protein